MPDVAMPNGDVVNFPDDMPREQIKGLIASKFPEVTKPKNSELVADAKGLKEGLKQGATFGFNDEAQAAIAAGTVGLHNLVANDDMSMGDAYDTALQDFRTQTKEAKANAPKSFFTGEIGGSLVTGSKLPGGKMGDMSGTPMQAATRAGATGLGLGALSGGVYGFGTGEGGASSRAGNAALVGAMGGGLGGVAGAASGYVANTLAARAAKLLEIKRAAQSGQTPPMTGPSVAPPAIQSSAMQRVVDKLRKDYPDPDQFNEVMRRLQSGDITLAELGGQATQNLAKGSAQYPSGEGTMQEFFHGKAPEIGAAPTGGAIDKARQNVTASIEKNVSGNQDYLGTLDQIVAKGQAKAAPLYDEAYAKNPAIVSKEVDKILMTPAGKSALKQAAVKMQNDRSLMALPDKELGDVARDLVSMGKMSADDMQGGISSGLRLRSLDYVKRALDDQIDVAQRAGEKDNARILVGLKKSLVNELDKADVTGYAGPNSLKPEGGAYARARAAAGDYLSNKSAMENGYTFKGNSKQIARDFGGLGDTEKEAYKAGVVQKVREMADSVRDNGNAYTKIFGTPETRAKLKAVLSDDQYKQLSDDLFASDRIYKLKDRILGNSTTTSKAISAAEFASPDNAILQELANGRPVSAGISGATQWVKKAFDGLSDKDAGEVARILTATSEKDKLKIIRQIADKLDPKAAAKQLTGPEGKQLQTYYAIQDMIKPYRAGALAGSAGALASQPLQITVRPEEYYKDRDNK